MYSFGQQLSMNKVKSTDHLFSRAKQAVMFSKEQASDKDHDTESSMQDLTLYSPQQRNQDILKRRVKELEIKVIHSMHQMSLTIQESRADVDMMRRKFESLNEAMIYSTANRNSLIAELEIVLAHYLQSFSEASHRSIKKLELIFMQQLTTIQLQIAQQTKRREAVIREIQQRIKNINQSKTQLKTLISKKMQSNHNIQEKKRKAEQLSRRLREEILKNKVYWRKKMVEAGDYCREVQKMLSEQIQTQRKKRELNKEDILEKFEKLALEKGVNLK